MDRYTKNNYVLSDVEQIELAYKKICVIGLGGLGGYISEMLVRLGVRNIVLADGDVFSVSNLNRQILSTEDNIGESKVAEAKKRLIRIDKEVIIKGYEEYVDEKNIREIIHGCDIVMDGTDNIATRFIVEAMCLELGIPLVHGAVAEWTGQVSTIMPGDNTLCEIYGDIKDMGPVYTPSFLPPIVASIQVSEMVKVIFNKGDILKRKILVLDIKNNRFDVVKL